jgi:prepilin-type N-terminal cleavage/methylation domain-containing protein
MKKAFTLLELIFVIVILGVVSSIGSSVIVQVYESYIIQKATHNASIKTELAINQLANRLAYRINRSLVAREPATDNILTLQQITTTTLNKDDYTAFEWIGYDNDGFSATNPPGWSGFADLNASSFATISSTGSDFTTESTVLGNLGIASPAIVFMANRYDDNSTEGYTAQCLHDITGNGCIFPVTLAGTTMTFTGVGKRVSGNMVYSEFYQLAGSAYIVVPENPHTILGTNVWDLMLYSQYQPWDGERYDSTTGHLIAKNVSVFRFKEEANSLRIKICSIEQISDVDKISLCKEKAVIR